MQNLSLRWNINYWKLHIANYLCISSLLHYHSINFPRKLSSELLCAEMSIQSLSRISFRATFYHSLLLLPPQTQIKTLPIKTFSSRWSINSVSKTINFLLKMEKRILCATYIKFEFSCLCIHKSACVHIIIVLQFRKFYFSRQIKWKFFTNKKLKRIECTRKFYAIWDKHQCRNYKNVEEIPPSQTFLLHIKFNHQSTRTPTRCRITSQRGREKYYKTLNQS